MESKGTILNVDDTPAARYVTTKILHAAGFEVIEASTGSEAIALAASKPDLILLDINLPDINGFDVAKELKANPDTSSIPILYLSATYKDAASRVRGLESGADGYLTHPVEAPVLIATVNAILRAHRAETARSAAARQLQTIFDATGDAICLLDSEERIVKCNKGMTALTGKSTAELEGNFCREVPDGAFEPCRSSDLKKIRTREVLDLSYGDRCYHVTIDPIIGDLGEFNGAVYIMSDVTQFKELEAERLRASKLESISILAGGIAHDFNNFLTAILGNITLAKMYSKPGDNIYNKLEDSEKACIQAKDLTQQLFAFSRGGAPIIKTTPMSRLIKDAAVFALRGANTRLVLEIAEDLWPAQVDEGQIRQVIYNTVLNASQSMPEGGVVKITAENSVVRAEDNLPLEQGPYVKIQVTDHGVGIPKDHLSKVFDPYFSTKQKGSGLGLTVSYAIIKNHKGYIDIQSEIGVGTTVIIYLPASTEETSPDQTTPSEDLIPGRGRILVMEDEEMVREVLKHILLHLGYAPEFAQDGQEAIDTYKRAMEAGKPFDAVIMDLTIPGGMGGKEAIQRLLKIDPKVRAIVSSGYSQDPIMSDYSSYGFTAVIAKPYRIEELSRVLYNVLYGRKS